MLVRELGSGGMSSVYLGRDEVLGRPVAVKVLDPDLDDEETGALFRREGRMAARLSHPNIVPVYDAREDAMGGREVSYIVMEFVPGGDLRALMDRRGALPEGLLSRLGADVAAALTHAHERGVIHRDVKPRNVLLDERGNPKLTDFGIARALDTTQESRAGHYLGTAAYSSPEQLQGHKVTPRSDVYSLGATLYHAAVGEPPFAGTPIEVANQHILKKPVPPRERGAPIGAGLENLILDCLAKDPESRPDVSRVLEKLCERVGPRGDELPADRDRIKDPARAGSARAAGLSTFGEARRRIERWGSRGVSGPPEETVNVPTRTFRSGSRQRTVLAALIGTALVLALAALSWSMLGSDAETTQSNDVQQASNTGRGGGAEEPAGGAEGGTSGGDSGQTAQDAGGGGSQEGAAGPSLPVQQAEQVVFDMYVDQSYREVGSTWNVLSSRLQGEIGSPQEWAQREQIDTFTDMYYIRVPQARAAGDEAEVRFSAELFREAGSEILSGTWICVTEDGRWKLDRLEDKRSTAR